MEIWLGLLAAVWAILLFGGFVLGSDNPEKTYRMPLNARLSSSFALVIAGWCWVLAVGTKPGDFALFIALGMTFGFIGDLCMASVIPLPQPALGGIGAFGVGHVFYIIAMLTFGNSYGLDSPVSRWLALVIWWLIGLGGWYIVVGRKGKPDALRLAALPYALLLSSIAGFASGLAVQSGGFSFLAIGAALFLFSDLLIAAQLFSGLNFRHIGDVIWLTYGPAQFLIVYSIINALAVSGAS
ncbi:lysoplasmalogenase [Candidatus Chlorohelix sp.]|uniref:lysoplasmalogenase n=1 Tax=Candidatus Chlorohelix sp. TaxID=3139201 RepID=UPI003038E988